MGQEVTQIALNTFDVFSYSELAPRPMVWLLLQCKCGWTVWRGTACKPIEEHCVCYRHPEDREKLLSCEDRGEDGWHCSRLRIFPPQDCPWHDHASKHTSQDPIKWTKASAFRCYTVWHTPVLLLRLKFERVLLAFHGQLEYLEQLTYPYSPSAPLATLGYSPLTLGSIAGAEATPTLSNR